MYYLLCFFRQYIPTALYQDTTISSVLYTNIVFRFSSSRVSGTHTAVSSTNGQPIEGSRKRRVRRPGERSSSEQRSGDQSYSSHSSTHSLLTSQLVRSSRSAGDQGADQDLPGDQTSGHDDLTNAHRSDHGQVGHGRAAGRAGPTASVQHRAPSACHATDDSAGELGGIAPLRTLPNKPRNPNQ